MLKDITPEATNWRSGIICNPPSLDAESFRRMQTEMNQSAANVAIKRQRGAHVAFVAKTLREGDVVCSAGGLLFDSLDRLVAFIHSNDCGKDSSATSSGSMASMMRMLARPRRPSMAHRPPRFAQPVCTSS